MTNLNKFIDHTKLGPNVVQAEIDQLIQEALKYDFCSVCIDPIWVKYAKSKLSNSAVKVCTVIGFPSGAHTIEAKEFEAKQAILNGCDELDYVINVSRVLDNDRKYIFNEMISLRNVAKGKTLKIILETCYLNEEQIRWICENAIITGINFVKTSTGFGKGGATFETVGLMVEVVGKSRVQVKASGGIRDYETAKRYIELGATRLGTSKGVEIVNNSSGDNNANSSY
jgi:deoxyribose-phosphate aldolase